MSPQAAFEVLNRAAGIAPLALPKFEGNEAALPTPFRAAAASAVALAFGAATAAEVWRFRGGERQAVSIDFAAAAASLASAALMRRDGEELSPAEPSPVTGFYQSSDQRWLYLHGGSGPERLLQLLNAEAGRNAVMESVSRWNGRALEDAMAYLNLSGALVRSEEEWRSSVAGRVLGAPIVLKKIADGPPARLKENAAPLGGFRVLDVTRMVAGPTASRLLANYGADVLNVCRSPEVTLADPSLLAGKRRTVLDLSRPADAETLRRLARDGDIFVDSFRPGALAAFGFSPASLDHIAPGIIYVSISGYGVEGPWATRRGWEEVTQAATGMAAEQGAFLAARRRRDLQPGLLPGAVCGTLTGQLAAAGALAAVLRRIREGGSWLVEVSLAATAMWLSSLGRNDAGRVPESWAPGLDQYRQSCETKDGRFEFLGPVVRLPKTPPLKGALPDEFPLPVWASAHEEANAAEIQPA